MPIKYVQGNLLDSKADVLFHGANCFCTFGSGIALQIKQKYPEAYQADCRTNKGDKEKLGSLSYANISTGQAVFNLYSQYKYGRDKQHANYDAIRSALTEMKVIIDHSGNDNMTIAGPRIGCGLAGGDWNVVSKIIEEVFPDREILIYDFNGVETNHQIKDTEVKPQVVNIRLDKYDVYIGRAGNGMSGEHGNPIVVGQVCQRCGELHAKGGDTLPCYKAFLEEKCNRDSNYKKSIMALEGLTLGCFCAKKGGISTSDEHICHGQVIHQYISEQKTNSEQRKNMVTISIVGTAGRDKEKAHLMTKELYYKMYKKVLDIISVYPDTFETIQLKSGGAAWADHIAVSIHLKKLWPIELHLPCAWDFDKHQYMDDGTRDWRNNPGGTSNYYHRIFSKTLGGNSFNGIERCINNPVNTTIIGRGFHDRNLEVGKCDVLIALTWGEGDVPCDGGTKHTWDNSSAKLKIHIPLSSLL